MEEMKREEDKSLIEREKEERKAEKEAIEMMIREEYKRLMEQAEKEWKAEREVMEMMKREEEDNEENGE